MTLRAPHFSGKRPRKVQSPQPIPNLLVATLLVAFVPVIFPAPQAQATQQPVQTNAPAALLDGTGEKPFAQTEWPNPTVAIKVQTPVQAVNPLSIMEDIGEKPFFQTEWPDPPPVVIQTPFQHQKHSALTVTPLPPISAAFLNPTFPRAQQPYQLQKPLVLFEPCDFGLTGFISTTPTDISTTISENIDILGTISENIDVRGLISTDSIDLTTTISENIDLFTTICET